MPIPKMLQDANNHEVQAGRIGTQLPPLALGGAPVNTAVIDTDKDSLIRIFAGNDLYLDIGPAAAAAGTHLILPAGFVEYFVVPKGAYVSVLEVNLGGGGDARITVMG